MSLGGKGEKHNYSFNSSFTEMMSIKRGIALVCVFCGLV